jgi:biotin carboxyl carrier protein
MKLENEVNAPKDCEIVEVLVNKGDNVNTNQVLIKIK